MKTVSFEEQMMSMDKFTSILILNYRIFHIYFFFFLTLNFIVFVEYL